MKRQNMRFGLLFLAFLVVLVERSNAQVTTATLYAIVVDPSDAVIANATVTLREAGTGATTEQISDASGECAFTFVPIGQYTVSIRVTGFKELTVSGLTLNAGQNVRRKFMLEVGEVSEKVDVTAEAPLVNMVSAEQLFTQKSEQIEEMPLARRRASDLFSIGTAIQRNASTVSNNNAGGFRMNGLAGGAANITMDGIPASGHPGASQAGLRGGFNYIEIASLEAIEEISIAKGAFSAEFAHALSGNINVITKSGTNRWHGSLFEAFNAEELNGRPAFLTVRPPLTFNQFGGSLGGPIWKDKIFIFGAYEGYRDRRFTPRQGLVFTERMRNDMISAFPAYRQILDEAYLPNQPHDPRAATALHIGPAPFKANTNHFIFKPEVWLSSRARVSATWLRDRPDLLFPDPELAPGPHTSRTFTGTVDRLNVTFTTMGTNWSAETRLGRNRVDNHRNDEARETLGDLSSISGLGVIIGNGQLNFIGNAPQWILEQKVTVQRGRHSLKFGGLLNRGAYGEALSPEPRLQYNTEQDFLTNAPSSGRFDFGANPWIGRLWNWGLFIQDDWKVNPNLVLNFGIRYDSFGRMIVKGEDGSPSPSLFLAPFLSFSTFALGPFRPIDDPYDGDPSNFGPRFGFAYNPDGSEKTVIRGGFGMMFMPPNLSVFELSPLNTLDVPVRLALSKPELERLGIRFPTSSAQVAELTRTPGGGARSIELVDTKYRAPYTTNYTLGIQRALTSTLMLETAFVGTSSRGNIMQRIYNLPDRVTGVRPNPNLFQARYWDNSDSTTYASWQTSLRKRYSSNLTGEIHYTWGKTLSYGDGDLSYASNATTQEFLDVRAERGRAKEDLQHVFVGSFIYTLPTLQTSAPVLRYTLGGWQGSGLFRAQTGYPIDIVQPTARPASRPDLLDFKGAILNEGLQWLNPAAFARVPINAASGQPARPGTIGRFALDAPGRWNLDFSLAKNFQITEGTRIQLRADMLNVFNHVDLVDVANNITASNFGRLVGATGPRIIQFHLRFAF